MSAPPAHPVAELYADHHRWLHAWLRRKLGRTHYAADVAHGTFLRLLSREDMPAFQEPRAYLTRIARNLMADHWRRQELERAYLDALALLPEPEYPSPESRLLIVDTLLRIDRCLHGLPALTRRIFLRFQRDGLTYAGIATGLGVSLPTVKRHMSKAFLACLSVE
ncbi:sigma-70 family RNA polymerase sigma factor [Azoarcus indigens]|uniref:RNA polymerase sigma-70 factor (ECF subfamily) n=1 Tax=Azoarcus indigens TaxID=29545 RepID=A0A4R6DLE3_9RHOO|nr:sigma-70 family RNA polymerase sigma factor [Azoarcus indigens]NMG66955.1 sigma-70 family RNA polymerase sigma factor [Azoarcus indigens]TDN44998.1 RNA polymerase sigma-70 factor (ECF subfamily) [Azoarcus indigens]